LSYPKTAGYRTDDWEPELTYRNPKFLRDLLSHLLIRFHDENDKFFAAPPRKQIGFPHLISDDARYLNQHAIADLMPVHVIDILEVIDVEQDQRKSGLIAF